MYGKNIKYLWVCGAGVLLSLLSMTLWSIWVILNYSQELSLPSITPAMTSAGVIEKHAVLDDSYLEKLWPYLSEELTYQEWKEAKSFSPLGALIHNQCERNYCLYFPVSFEELPSHTWKALVGVEDKRYFKHHGVDPKSLARAAYKDIKAMAFVEGGSTLTQQLIKNLFLTQEKSIQRKFKEMVLSLYLETKYSKEEILSLYLNRINWGSFHGIRVNGIGAAARVYLGKKPEDLSAYESSLLIGMLKSPYLYHPIYKPENAKKRSKIVHNLLKEIDFIDGTDSSWSEKEWMAYLAKMDQKQWIPWMRTIWEISTKKRDGLSDLEQGAMILSVFEVAKEVEKRSEKRVAVKAIVKDLSCGDCNDFQFYSSFERDEAKALEAEKTQVGSILKPITYHFLMEGERLWEELVETKPISLKLLSGNWTPRDGPSDDEIPISEALKRSRNIPLIRLSQEYGFEKLESKLEEVIPRLKTPLKEFPAQLLGAVELTMSEIVEIYSWFIRKECEPIRSQEKEWERSVLYQLTDPTVTTLRNVVRGPLRYWRFFGKTGTSNRGLDNWFIAFDGRKVMAIWLGDEEKELGSKLIVSGASGPFKIFQGFVNRRGDLFDEVSCDFVK